MGIRVIQEPQEGEGHAPLVPRDTEARKAFVDRWLNPAFTDARLFERDLDDLVARELRKMHETASPLVVPSSVISPQDLIEMLPGLFEVFGQERSFVQEPRNIAEASRLARYLHGFGTEVCSLEAAARLIERAFGLEDSA